MSEDRLAQIKARNPLIPMYPEDERWLVSALEAAGDALYDVLSAECHRNRACDGDCGGECRTECVSEALVKIGHRSKGKVLNEW